MKHKTPMQRSTKPMKRTTINPKRRRKADTDASLNLRAEYREKNPECEVTKFLHDIGKLGEGKFDFLRDTRLECDHIWGGTGGRLDLWSMLIMVSGGWHDWKTANFTAGVLLFLVVKYMKGETNAAEFHQCSGMTLSGWLDLDKTRDACPEWLEPFRIRLLSSLK